MVSTQRDLLFRFSFVSFYAFILAMRLIEGLSRYNANRRFNYLYATYDAHFAIFDGLASLFDYRADTTP